MATIQTTTNPGLIEEGKHSAVNWGAVIAGSVTTAALTLVLLAFGAGVGFSVVSPWADSGVSAATFSLGAGLFLIVVAMLSSTIGGFIAGRLRTKWVPHLLGAKPTFAGYRQMSATAISFTMRRQR